MRMAIAREADKAIDANLCVFVCVQAYRPCAQRASILFFVLNDLGCIDPMYQFSLDAYINLFILSIESSPRSHKLEERINNLNRHHTYAVYRSEILTHTCIDFVFRGEGEILLFFFFILLLALLSLRG